MSRGSGGGLVVSMIRALLKGLGSIPTEQIAQSVLKRRYCYTNVFFRKFRADCLASCRLFIHIF